jgi:antitoxin VapB
VPHTAKLFRSGRSQAVRLPAPFRFEGDEVFIRRDETRGDVILSSKPSGWNEFFALIQKGGAAPVDFLGSKERGQTDDRADPFDGWSERRCRLREAWRNRVR